MVNKIRAISEMDLEVKNTILIRDVEYAFTHYSHLIYTGKEESYCRFLKGALVLNGETDSYVDFYYKKLDETEQSNFVKALSEKDVKCLDLMDWREGIYFPLTEEIIPFLSKITAREILFSTFYFTKYPCTVWGNYELRYPMFFRDEETKRIYQDMARFCGLDLG